METEYTPEQVGLIRRTICKDATPDELTLFIGQCRRTGLDPFSRQIHAVKRAGRLTVQVGIDGLRLIADRTGETDGQEGPYWCGDDGVWHDVWLRPEPPAACKVIVYRNGRTRGYPGVAHWKEFYQPQGGMWNRLPAVMIAKVAESIALRKAFPHELSGLYSPEEMEQANREQVAEAVHQIAEHTPGVRVAAELPSQATHPAQIAAQLRQREPGLKSGSDLVPQPDHPAVVESYSHQFDRCTSRKVYDDLCVQLATARKEGRLTDRDRACLVPFARNAARKFPAPPSEDAEPEETPQTEAKTPELATAPY